VVDCAEGEGSELESRRVGRLASMRGRWVRISGEALWVGMGQGVAALGSLFGVRLLTHVMSTLQYGRLALGMTAALLIQQIVTGPLVAASMRFFAPSLEARQLRTYVGAIKRSFWWSCLVLGGVGGIVWLSILLSGRHDLSDLVAASVLLALFVGCESTLDGMQNANRQRRIAAWHDALSAWLRYGLAYLLVVRVLASSAAAMTGFAVATFIVVLSQLFFFHRKITGLMAEEPAPSRLDVVSMTSRMWSYSWPFATWGFIVWAQLISDEWAVQLFRGSHAVGLYSALYQIAFFPIALLTNAVVILVSPVVFGRAGAADDAQRVRSVGRTTSLLTWSAVAISVAGTLIAVLARHLVLATLVGPAFRSTAGLFAPLVLAGGLFAAGQLSATKSMTTLETRRLIAPKIITGLVGVAMNFLAASFWGLTGVVYANLAFSVFYLTWMLWLHRSPDETG
jgi:O-antigen/teichoic acid export membrane protein